HVGCFRRMLERITFARPSERRPVIGVYVGWRGDSMSVPYLNAITFWDRKDTAHQIGERAGRDLLLELDSVYRAESKKQPMTMITIGHSFGGALVFSALERKMIGGSKGRRVVLPLAAATEREAGLRPLRTGLGDLVVLVNPAFEAKRYTPFAE